MRISDVDLGISGSIDTSSVQQTNKNSAETMKTQVTAAFYMHVLGVVSNTKTKKSDRIMAVQCSKN